MNILNSFTIADSVYGSTSLKFIVLILYVFSCYYLKFYNSELYCIIDFLTFSVDKLNFIHFFDYSFSYEHIFTTQMQNKRHILPICLFIKL